MSKVPNLEHLVNDSIVKYPTLYRIPGDPVTSRLRVLNHLFLVIGNGYEWNKAGFLEDAYGRKRKLTKTLPKWIFDKDIYALHLKGKLVKSKRKVLELLKKDKFPHYVPEKSTSHEFSVIFQSLPMDAYELVLHLFGDEKYMGMPLREREEDYLSDPEKRQRAFIYADFLSLSPADAFPFGLKGRGKSKGGITPYPLSKYSAISEMLNGRTDSPCIENFKLVPHPKWAAGAVDVAKAALEYYLDHERYSSDSYHPSRCLNSFKEMYDKAKAGPKKEFAAFLKDHGYLKGETPKQHCERCWERHLKEQVDILERFIKKFTSVKCACGKDVYLSEAKYVVAGDHDGPLCSNCYAKLFRRIDKSNLEIEASYRERGHVVIPIGPQG